MNQINYYLETAVDLLNRLYGLPMGLLIIASCIVFGYVLKSIRSFPNDGIPVAVILWGIAFSLLTADPCSDDLPLRIWLAKYFCIGAILGFVAWMLHRLILSRIENWLVGKSPTIAKILNGGNGSANQSNRLK